MSYDEGFYDDMWEDTSYHYSYPSASDNELERFDWNDAEGDDDFIDEEVEE